MSLNLVTAPTVEPVTLSEAKTDLRVTADDEDSLITSMIQAARGMAETITHRALTTQTWDWKLDGFPNRWLEVPLAPLVSVSSISYIDIAGATQTWSAAEYIVVDAGAMTAPGRIVPAYGKSWPNPRGLPNDITVRFVAGYGGASSVPAEIRWALLLIVGELYARRESALVGATIVNVPYSAEMLLSPYVVRTF
jgi:uncharacterized phiE125 gp8 family phage protein